MTVYRMYAQNGNRAGFWIQHRGWDNACALVLSIGGLGGGPLPGRPPLHGDAEVIVRRHDVRSGRVLAAGARLDDPGDKNYAFIAEPSWSRGGSDGGGPPAPYQDLRPNPPAAVAAATT